MLWRKMKPIDRGIRIMMLISGISIVFVPLGIWKLIELIISLINIIF